MRIQDVMTTDLKCINPETSLIKANDMMWRQEIHHLIVIDDNGQPIGILSDTDLGGDLAKTLPDNQTVAEYMSAPLITGTPETTLKDAINLMEGHHIHALVVVDETKKLVGIVTTRDIERLHKRGTAQPPFIDDESTGKPYLPLQKRNQRGSKAKYGEYTPTVPSHKQPNV